MNNLQFEFDHLITSTLSVMAHRICNVASCLSFYWNRNTITNQNTGRKLHMKRIPPNVGYKYRKLVRPAKTLLSYPKNYFFCIRVKLLFLFCTFMGTKSDLQICVSKQKVKRFICNIRFGNLFIVLMVGVRYRSYSKGKR